MPYDEDLANRLRELLADEDNITEKKMFGGLAFLTGGNLAVGVRGDDLMARIGAAGTAAALATPGVRPCEMGSRTMRGWILVDGEALDDEALDSWLATARAFVADLPPK